MLRARRALVVAASGAQPTVRLGRRLHAPPVIVRSDSASLHAVTTTSRFAIGATRGLMTMRRQNLVRGTVPQQLQAMQLRWRSAMSDEQHEQLAKHMNKLAACRDNGNWRQALKLLDRIDKEGFALDAEMYELAMAACARMGKIEVLPGLLQNMEVDSLLPTNRTVDFVMQAYIAAEEWKLIVKLAKEVTSKGVPLSDAAFQAAFESCGKMRDATSARQILLNVEATGSLDLDQSHYAAAIRACGMGGRPDVAANLFAHMEEKRGIAADGDVFNQLVRAQIVNGALAQALQTFATVNERHNVEMPESIYTATIDALVTEGEFWQASQLFSQMLAHDLSPSVFCYGRMMVAYVRLNKHPLARECWQRVLAINEPTPNLTKYAKMVSQLSSTNDSELATTIFEYIFPRYDPAYIRDTTYAAAIRAYGRLGRTQTAVDLFDTFVANRRRVDKPLPRSAGIYLAVFNALSRDTERDPNENSRDAKRVWDIMTESVPVVLAPAYASLAGVFASSGDISTLEELLQHAEHNMKEMDISPRRGNGRRDIYSTRADAAFGNPFETTDADEDEDQAYEGEIVGGAVGWRDELLFNGVISGFSKARNDQSPRVMDYLAMMRDRGMKITDSVVRASTDTFVKHAQWPRMYDLMDFVDVRDLQNADVCFGDTISKLLEAGAWEPAQFWISRAHRLGVQPPIRGKMEALHTLQQQGSQEWQIAYALARETLSFKQMVQENIDSVADAADVCANANRADLVIKLFERTATHASVTYRELKLPLRLFKQTLLACMRENATTPDFEDGTETPIQKAENICAQMLQAYPVRRRDRDVEDAGNALDGDALSLAISIKATLGDDDDVLALFEKMQQHGLTPNSYAYNAAIMAYSRASRLDRVLEVRNALHVAPHGHDILREPKITQSLLFSIAIGNDAAAQRDHIASTRAMLPHVTSGHIVQAFLQANRLDKCAEYFDHSVPSELFYTTLRRALGGSNAKLSAHLVLQYVAFHGFEKLKPTGLVLDVAKQLLQAGKLREARTVLDLVESELVLSDQTQTFQKDALEVQLQIYGEQQSFEDLGALFDRTMPSTALRQVRHYQRAMEYCVNGSSFAKKRTKKQREQAATACLKLFETMRLQFVKPNGAVYLLALQSCQMLGRLDVTGARVIRDAVDQGFGYMVGTELYRLANIAVRERSTEISDREPKKRRKNAAASSAYQVDGAELATLALFCHHRGVPVSWRLAQKLLALGAEVPTEMGNELTYIAEVADKAYHAKKSKADETQPDGNAHTTRNPKTGKAGARWGELYLQKMPSDE